MKIVNSYIFLLRNESKFKKDEKGNMILDFSINVLNFLKKIFDVEVDETTIEEIEEDQEKFDEVLERIESKLETGFLKFYLDEKEHCVEFKLNGADSTEYLDVIVEDENREDAIKIMEYINDLIVGESNIFDEHFITIVSYDCISEHYCNLIYPRLNEFERKFRKLLFIIYTASFKKLYFEETVSKEVIDKVKANLQSKGGSEKKREDFLKHSMYSLDFGTMQQLLFERNWLSYDEKQLNKYLNKNKDLTQLSDEELRSKMLSIKPTNDWERLFSNKNLDDNFEDVIKQIGKLRNCVAHNKLFNKEKYYQLLDLLDKNSNDIDDAILITETEDFKRINNEKFNDSLEQLGKVMSELAKSVSNITKTIIDNCSVGKTLSNLIPKFSFSEIIKENLENTEIGDLNKNILSENPDDDLIE